MTVWTETKGRELLTKSKQARLKDRETVTHILLSCRAHMRKTQIELTLRSVGTVIRVNMNDHAKTDTSGEHLFGHLFVLPYLQVCILPQFTEAPDPKNMAVRTT